MRHFFRRKSSCQIAKDRLKILLISDRVNCSPEIMELIKMDIAKVLSKYMKIDSENMEIQGQLGCFAAGGVLWGTQEL